jgi:hypothetical protein
MLVTAVAATPIGVAAGIPSGDRASFLEPPLAFAVVAAVVDAPARERNRSASGATSRGAKL